MVGTVYKKLLGVLLLFSFFIFALVFHLRISTLHACAFDPLRPNTYEADSLRQKYINALDAAAENQLFPGDFYFGLPRIEIGGRYNRVSGERSIPVEILRAIGWVESSLTMASRSTKFESVGTSLVSFDCGHGIMQVTSGMTVPIGIDGKPNDKQVAVATSYPHNIARGAAVLAAKWNNAPQSRPIVGTDTNSDPSIIENCYYAVWAYNGFTGPASTKSNHPLDPTFQWPRSPYQCDGTQSRSRFPYQELVWGCMSNPAYRYGERLWVQVLVSLPNFNDPNFYNALSVSNFSFPYKNMDIPTPKPSHQTSKTNISSSVGEQIIGSPQLQVSQQIVTLRVNGSPDQAKATIYISNTGSGLMPWSAKSSDSFLITTPPAGIAVGSNISCKTGNCSSVPIELTINPSLLPASSASTTVTISSPEIALSEKIQVRVYADFEVASPGTSRASD